MRRPLILNIVGKELGYSSKLYSDISADLINDLGAESIDLLNIFDDGFVFHRIGPHFSKMSFPLALCFSASFAAYAEMMIRFFGQLPRIQGGE